RSSGKARLIEPVKGLGVTTTKYRVRWWGELTDDHRFCSFPECVEIAGTLLEQLTGGWLDNPQHMELTQLCYDYSVIPYEVPLDYVERPATTDLTTRIHRLTCPPKTGPPEVVESALDRVWIRCARADSARPRTSPSSSRPTPVVRPSASSAVSTASLR